MVMSGDKSEVITFKVDAALAEALRIIPNRSQFIRTAISDALASTCPLCQGKGFLTPSQKEHWDIFSKSHPVEKCLHCEELRLICEHGKTETAAD
jgi:hypothetical protein